MECFSSKKILEFDFNLYNDISIESNLLNYKNPKLIADIEGDLRIIINSNEFFSEKKILLLELAVYLTKWINANRNKENINFIFDTMDHEEPILEFIKGIEGDSWTIKSIWSLSNCSEVFSFKEILFSVGEFIENFDFQLQSVYGISVNNFLN